jgi:hypothetical protein
MNGLEAFGFAIPGPKKKSPMIAAAKMSSREAKPIRKTLLSSDE